MKINFKQQRVSKLIRENWSKIILTILMLFLGIIMIIPFFWMISASLKTELGVFSYPIKWIPDKMQFSNYTKIWLNEAYPFYKFYINSLFVSIITVIGMLFVSSTAAYAFARLEFKGKNVLFLMFLATLMIPQHVTLIPRFILFKWLGLYDTLWSLIFSGIFNVIGIFLLRQFFVGIPKELSDAAKIDGASHFQIYFRIILPLAKPALLSLVILTFVWSWNDYINPLVFITSKEFYTIPLGLQAYLDMDLPKYSLVMAGAASAILPLIIVFIITQKYFITGIVTSGLKE